MNWTSVSVYSQYFYDSKSSSIGQVSEHHLLQRNQNAPECAVPSPQLPCRICQRHPDFGGAKRWELVFIKIIAQNLRLSGANLSGGDYNMRTPLHVAAATGNDAAVEYLLRHGASVHIRQFL